MHINESLRSGQYCPSIYLKFKFILIAVKGTLPSCPDEALLFQQKTTTFGHYKYSDVSSLSSNAWYFFLHVLFKKQSNIYCIIQKFRNILLA